MFMTSVGNSSFINMNAAGVYVLGDFSPHGCCIILLCNNLCVFIGLASAIIRHAAWYMKT